MGGLLSIGRLSVDAYNAGHCLGRVLVPVSGDKGSSVAKYKVRWVMQ